MLRGLLLVLARFARLVAVKLVVVTQRNPPRRTHRDHSDTPVVILLDPVEARFVPAAVTPRISGRNCFPESKSAAHY